MTTPKKTLNTTGKSNINNINTLNIEIKMGNLRNNIINTTKK